MISNVMITINKVSGINVKGDFHFGCVATKQKIGIRFCLKSLSKSPSPCTDPIP